MSTDSERVRSLLETWRALDVLRVQAHEGDGAYCRRLVKVLGGEYTEPAEPSASREVPSAFGWLNGRRVLRLVAVLRRILRQTRRLSALPASDLRDTLIINLASNRLNPSRGQSVRDALAIMLQGIGGQPGLQQRVQSAKVILLFDPLQITSLQDSERRFDEERVVVIDGSFIAFTAASAILAGWWRFPRLAAAAWISRRQSGASVSRAAFCCLLSAGLHRLLSRFTNVSAVFLTSNSLLTELLRAYLIHAPECREVIEVMHGVGSIPAERYFGIVTGSETVGQKHRFVPQIPGLPLPRIFSEQALGPASLAINPYLYQHFSQDAHGRWSPDRLTDRFWALAGVKPQSRTPLVIAVFGNAVNGAAPETVGNSASYLAEKLLLGLVSNTLSAAVGDAVLLYVPHPTLRGMFAAQPSLCPQPFAVANDTALCWLTADGVVSLASSAMFEARYFGARVFTPMVAEDELFGEAYLRCLCHPRTSTYDGLRESLDEFLGSVAVGSRLPIAEKVTTRLEAMFGHAVQDSVA